MGWRDAYVKFISNHPHKRGAELGVLGGESSVTLLKNLPNLERLYCVDHWRNLDAMASYVERIKPYKNRVRTLWLKSVEAHVFVEDDSLDFLFIDADHIYRSVIADIVCWEPKVREGGIISGHDYGSQKYDVKGAVDKVFPNAVIMGRIWWLYKGVGRGWTEWTGA